MCALIGYLCLLLRKVGCLLVCGERLYLCVMEVRVKVSKKFAKLYDLPVDTSYVILMGGRGGGKTYEASKFISFSATLLDKRCQILRDEAVGIKESIMNEILLRFDTANRDGVFDKSFSRLGNGIKNTKTGEMAVFSKGFRASSLEKKANMKSVSNIDIAVIEEAEDLRDEDKFNTFSDSIRKEGSVIIIILNTPDIHHWIVKRFFDAIPLSVDDEPDLLGEDLDGYFKLVPKGTAGVVCMQSNYTDNEFLPHKTKIQYEAYGDPASSMYNLHHYLTNIKGYSTTGLKGQIFKNYDMISLEEYNLIDSLEVFGVDFGTASPAGVVAVKIIGNDLYVRELNYEPCDLISLGKKLNDLGIGSHDLIVADCAEPTTILELRMGLEKYFSAEDRERYPAASYGFGNIRPSPDKSINSGISKMLGMRIHVVKGSDNLVKEFTMYVWATDRDGKSLDKPVDAYNHLCDPLRYITRVHGIWF